MHIGRQNETLAREVTQALVRTMEASLEHEVILDIEALAKYSDQKVCPAVMFLDDTVRRIYGNFHSCFGFDNIVKLRVKRET